MHAVFFVIVLTLSFENDVDIQSGNSSWKKFITLNNTTGYYYMERKEAVTWKILGWKMMKLSRNIIITQRKLFGIDPSLFIFMMKHGHNSYKTQNKIASNNERQKRCIPYFMSYEFVPSAQKNTREAFFLVLVHLYSKTGVRNLAIIFDMSSS